MELPSTYECAAHPCAWLTRCAACDGTDSDGDGLADVCDLCPGDPFSTSDANGLDGDGVCGNLDNVRTLLLEARMCGHLTAVVSVPQQRQQ